MKEFCELVNYAQNTFNVKMQFNSQYVKQSLLRFNYCLASIGYASIKLYYFMD